MVTVLEELDEFVQEQVHIWNAPGVGISIIQDSKVIFKKGYGYRDYGDKLPFTASTAFPIASNTKLFTAIAAGILVERGSLSFDQPIRDYAPALRFFDASLDATVTLRDMLGHRTGLPRYDTIWNESRFTQKELFERVRYMKPVVPLRSRLIYNNMVYEAVGHIIELPLKPYHYDRFDTADDEEQSAWSIMFLTSALGDVDRVRGAPHRFDRWRLLRATPRHATPRDSVCKSTLPTSQT